MRPTAIVGAWAAALLTAGLLVTPAAAAQDTGGRQTQAGAAAVTKLSHADASARFKAAGIAWRSSGNCSDRNRSTCTSFSRLNLNSALGAITLKKAGGCALTVTGGTETGHASGTYSHWNGYKLDFDPTSCLTHYITGTFTRIADRSDGAAQYKAASGNIYARESNHWDVTFHTCGGC
ncbi:hypothetical protein ACFU6R_27720 [Streptomyces sp. NPDC057499]|uniref:hypothetical protein n=1 Tax=Streptomyces sp. NPDC057499 TaxID=3346150 RepID=UPI0036BBF859